MWVQTSKTSKVYKPIQSAKMPTHNQQKCQNSTLEHIIMPFLNNHSTGMHSIGSFHRPKYTHVWEK